LSVIEIRKYVVMVIAIIRCIAVLPTEEGTLQLNGTGVKFRRRPTSGNKHRKRVGYGELFYFGYFHWCIWLSIEDII